MLENRKTTMYNTIHSKIIPNKDYENDIKYILELNRFFFRVLGIWPYTEKNSSYLESFKKISLILASYLFLLCDTVSMGLYVFIIEKDNRIRIKLVGPVIFAVLAAAKYTNLVFSSNKVKNCLARVDRDWRNVANVNARDLMVNKAKVGRQIVILCAVFMYTSGLYFRTIVPLSRKKIITDQNVTIRHLSCPAYFIFFDVHTSPTYEFAFLMQLISGFVKYTITLVICSMATLFSMHICAQLDILMVLMNNLVNERDAKNVDNRLAITVEHQIRARDFLQLVQETVQYTTLIEIMGCTIIMCLMLYNIIMEWENRNILIMCSYVVLLISVGFNIFILCFIGEQLSAEGEKLALTASTLAWYHLPDETARSIILIIAISNIPKKLKAGKFFDLSLKTFGDVVKATATYFNLLRNFI